MAGDWIKMRVGLESDPNVMELAELCDTRTDDVVFRLYRLICWMKTHGKNGRMPVRHISAVEHVFGGACIGVLTECGWIVTQGDTFTFAGFSKAHSERKGISNAIRRDVLSSGECIVCGETSNLEVDHDMPISRGGSSDRSNLVPMCRNCNRSKGTRTLDEYINGGSTEVNLDDR